MDPEAQLSFVASAVDALEGIRADEVAAVSAEVRRKITRHMQIVPTIADLVAEHRKRSRFTSSTTGQCRCGKGERAANGREDIHWIKVDGRSQIEACVDRNGVTA